MARIRSIKPEFPQSESIGHLSRDARLLFIQLWTHVDDEGRARAASRMLASLLYPYDDDAPELIDAWLSELEGEDMIRRYVVDGSTYLEIINWRKHQKIDKPSVSRLPAFEDGLVLVENIREASRGLATDLGPRTLDHDLGSNIRTVAVATRPARSSEFEEFKKAYPKRKGGNPWGPAEKLFRAALAQGATSEEIIGALRQGVGFDRDKIGTEFIPQAVKWLRDRRWEDYRPPPLTDPQFAAPAGAPSDEELRKRYARPNLAIPAEDQANGIDGLRADFEGELPRQGDEIRPSLRGFGATNH